LPLVNWSCVGNDAPWSLDFARYMCRWPLTSSPVSSYTVPLASTPIEACIDVRQLSPGSVIGAGTRSRTLTLRVKAVSPGLSWLTTTACSLHSFTCCQIPDVAYTVPSGAPASHPSKPSGAFDLQ